MLVAIGYGILDQTLHVAARGKMSFEPAATA